MKREESVSKEQSFLWSFILRMHHMFEIQGYILKLYRPNSLFLRMRKWQDLSEINDFSIFDHFDRHSGNIGGF
ncbi:hypothetical protein [Chryseobacterium sp. RU37D]|uniref:hypothetical protein n=1 Tax=Chryseobacterium sp. RU37D TaxID=1907397 RepID=UPI00117C41B8|nr:hypothetical protein [Chryseobacterium sp. RU37D]